MDFGKLQDISSVKWKLPDTAPSNSEFLKKIISTSSPKIYVGPTGWAMKEWLGKWYPAKTDSKEFLKYYSRQFNTVECNTTFYRIPDIKTVNNWKAAVPEEFRICIKVFQGISHAHDFGESQHLWEQFSDFQLLLKSNLGPAFFQLPPDFSPKQLSFLEKWILNHEINFPLAFEFRHSDWFKYSNAALKELLPLFREKYIGLVITDAAGRRDVLHQTMTAPFIVIRFVGNGLVESDFQRVDEWMFLLKEWVAQGLQEIYFFCHEPDNILAPELSNYVVQRCNEVFPNQTLKLPISYKEKITIQLSIFEGI